MSLPCLDALALTSAYADVLMLVVPTFTCLPWCACIDVLIILMYCSCLGVIAVLCLSSCECRAVLLFM